VMVFTVVAGSSGRMRKRPYNYYFNRSYRNLVFPFLQAQRPKGRE
jgi:hypothetical protein